MHVHMYCKDIFLNDALIRFVFISDRCDAAFIIEQWDYAPELTILCVTSIEFYRQILSES